MGMATFLNILKLGCLILTIIVAIIGFPIILSGITIGAWFIKEILEMLYVDKYLRVSEEKEGE